MNRFKSDSMNASSLDELEDRDTVPILDDERDGLLAEDRGEPASPGRSKKNKTYFDIDRPLSPVSQLGTTIQPLFSIMNIKSCLCCCCGCGCFSVCGKKKKKLIKSLFIMALSSLLLFVIIYQADIRLYFGYSVFDPFPVTNVTVHVHQACDFKGIRPTNLLPMSEDFIPEMPIACFDDEITSNDQFLLPRSWDVLPANSCNNISNLNSNVCIETSSSSDSGSITCLPSFMIIGFEKASTTELLLWLSYHPNLLGKWAETRFFSKVASPADLETKWRKYMGDIRTLPDGKKSIGKYWTYEKTPSYILNLNVAKNLRSIMPNIRLIVMVRNPAKRAYSAFAMYTQMVDYYSMKDTWNLAHLRYNSLVMRNLETGVVKFAISGGPGGSMVPEENLPRGDKHLLTSQKWRYISFPPDPQDFHDFLLHDRNFSYAAGGPQFNYRQRRIILEGYYSKFIKQWQSQFPTQHFLIIPMERLWNHETMENLNTLQRKMGIPVFDYRKVTTFDEDTKRYELSSASTFFLDKLFNTGDKVLPMLPESKKLLDNIYCESNRELKQMVGGSYLKGYSCTS